MNLTTQEPKAAIILAGGSSTRMKSPKALLEVQGVPLIQRVGKNLEPYFQEIIISTGGGPEQEKMFDFLPYHAVRDKEPGRGPLMGIYCGLEASSYELNFVIACDIPDIDMDFIRHMSMFTRDFEIVVPVTGEEKYEPLFAFYSSSLSSRIKDLLDRGVFKVIELYSIARTKFVPMDNNPWYRNLNTTADYHDYLNNTYLTKRPGHDINYNKK